MSEEPEASPSPYLRLPTALVAGVTAVVLVALLGLGVYASRTFRQPSVVLPATRVVAAQPSATPVPVVVAPSATSTSVVTPTVVVTKVATSPSVGVTETVTATPPSPSPVVSPSAEASPGPTVSPELSAEVGAAYQTYWQVRAQALYDLDTSHLSEVMAGEHLSSVEDLIAELQSEGRAIQTDVTHNYVVFEAIDDQAKIADEYVDNSIYVDGASKAVLSQPTGSKVREQYEMHRIDGVWRVVSLVRAT